MSHRDDQHYVIDLCDEVLGQKASREHRFDFLRGDGRDGKRGVPLPVDAFYEDLNLAIEYHERQHQSYDRVGLWDDKPTVSGVPRKQQRARYDQRRRDVLPEHGYTLIEVSIEEFGNSGRKLVRNRDADLAVVRSRLKGVMA